jgi:hypothetical protein
MIAPALPIDVTPDDDSGISDETATLVALLLLDLAERAEDEHQQSRKAEQSAEEASAK